MNNRILADPDSSLGSVHGRLDVAVPNLMSQKPTVEAVSIPRWRRSLWEDECFPDAWA